MAVGALTPMLWLVLTHEWWHLPQAEASAVWAALTWSQEARVHQLWRWLMETPAVDLARFRACWTPQQVCYVLDEVVREGRVSQRVVSRCQETILRTTTAEGAWRQ